jgi:hypothetical protein
MLHDIAAYFASASQNDDFHFSWKKNSENPNHTSTSSFRQTRPYLFSTTALPSVPNYAFKKTTGTANKFNVA